jgi:D-xylose transport system ATP-binding protein
VGESNILELAGVTKRFADVAVLRNVSFGLRAGEVHAICGENGAGKSTLIKLLSGIHPFGSYEGEYRIDGQPVQLRSVKEAEKKGIAVICQELALVDGLTVAENIFLGNEPASMGVINWNALFKKAAALLSRFRLSIDPGARVGDLGIGQKQLVEIVKALGKESRILILDEPTAALSDSEADILLDIIKDLRDAHGVSCIYISHKLDEVLRVANRITVLRDGESVGQIASEAVSIPEIVRAMVGREIVDFFPKRDFKHGSEVILELDGLSVADDASTLKPRLENVSFQLRSGEVLGIGGLMGAGRTELLMHIFGAYGKRLSGSINVSGVAFNGTTPGDAIEHGITLVTEDRKRYGLQLDQSVGFNLSLASLESVSTLGVVNDSEENHRNRKLMGTLGIKALSIESRVGGLSGGNQQKVVIGKSIMAKPRIILLDEPTRGIDVGAKVEVYKLINQLASEGIGVIVVSSELPELLGMSDRILMLREGRPHGIFAADDASQETLMNAAMGNLALSGE